MSDPMPNEVVFVCPFCGYGNTVAGLEANDGIAYCCGEAERRGFS